MILESLVLSASEFERRTGWAVDSGGACKGGRCVPLPPMDPKRLEVRSLAERLGMPLVGGAAAGPWSLGPESGGRALASANAPDLRLPDWKGREFRLASLRGFKVLLVAWASW